jgi:hypothetical protein
MYLKELVYDIWLLDYDEEEDLEKINSLLII